MGGAAAPLIGAIPSSLLSVVEKATEKNAGERYQSMRDLVVDLRRAARHAGDTVMVPPPVSRSQSAKAWGTGVRIGLVAAMVLLGSGLLFEWIRRPLAMAPRRVVQFDVPLPEGTVFTPSISRQPFAVSPDGKSLAFTATNATGTRLWIRDLASPEMRAIPGTEGVWSMYWAPDSRSIFFSVKTTLKQANLDTGSERTVAELPDMPMLATWRSSGDVLLYTGPGEMYELRLDGSSVQKLPVLKGMRWPQLLPGGDRLIYTTYDPAGQQSHVMTADYANRRQLALMFTDSRVQYAPPLHSGNLGYLLFIRGGSLLAQRFDAVHLRLSGEPFSIAQNVLYYGPNLSANFSISETGVLVYQTAFPNSELKWCDRTGRELGKAGAAMPYWGNVRISPDGRHVAAAVWSPENGATSIWSFDASGRESRRVTFPPDVYRRPVWSPDGAHLAVGRSAKVGGPQVAVIDIAPGGVGPQSFTAEADAHMTLPTDWSSDGRFIALDDGVGQEQHTAWIADIATHKLRPLLNANFAQWGIAFAPDVKRIAFVSTESGRPEIYVQSFAASPRPHATGDRRQISRDGAWLVRWRADGRELFFVGLDNMLHVVEFQNALAFSEPKPLFRIAGVPQYGTTRDFQFDVSPDGQRFVIPTTGSVPPPPFTFIENWQEKFDR